jgi:hypothetical protein
LAKGGKRAGAGRKTNEKKEIELRAAEIAKKFIEDHCCEVLETYLKNAAGHWEKRYTESGQEYEVFVSDPASTRHWIDKFVPTAKQEVDLNVNGSVEIYTNVRIPSRKAPD